MGRRECKSFSRSRRSRGSSVVRESASPPALRGSSGHLATSRLPSVITFETRPRRPDQQVPGYRDEAKPQRFRNLRRSSNRGRQPQYAPGAGIATCTGNSTLGATRRTPTAPPSQQEAAGCPRRAQSLPPYPRSPGMRVASSRCSKRRVRGRTRRWRPRGCGWCSMTGPGRWLRPLERGGMQGTVRHAYGP